MYADIRGGFSERGHQMTVGLSTTAIFGDLGSYFIGNFRDTVNNVIMAICYPLSTCNCKMNDLE